MRFEQGRLHYENAVGEDGERWMVVVDLVGREVE